MRRDGRAPDRLRPVHIVPGFLPYAEGSVLIAMGETRVICAVTVVETVPRHRRGSGRGWL
ncbi:MAG: ribonuclease PH, partial [Chloroflexi bacterium]|nr:ribonuclease PH [Chloroflexota bacterium]